MNEEDLAQTERLARQQVCDHTWTGECRIVDTEEPRFTPSITEHAVTVVITLSCETCAAPLVWMTSFISLDLDQPSILRATGVPASAIVK